MTKISVTAAWVALFVGTVVAANLALNHYGLVAVGFGVSAPAGVYFAGIAFTARDQLRERAGRAVAFGAVFVGALLSWWIEDIPRIAIASGVAFAFSEVADGLVYEPLRRRWATAVLASNGVGLVIDSVLFLWIAFGSLAYIEGQLVGKAVMTLMAVGILASVKDWRR